MLLLFENHFEWNGSEYDDKGQISVTELINGKAIADAVSPCMGIQLSNTIQKTLSWMTVSLLPLVSSSETCRNSSCSERIEIVTLALFWLKQVYSARKSGGNK